VLRVAVPADRSLEGHGPQVASRRCSGQCGESDTPNGVGRATAGPLPAVRLRSETGGNAASCRSIAWGDPRRAVVWESVAADRIWMVRLVSRAHRAPRGAQGVRRERQPEPGTIALLGLGFRPDRTAAQVCLAAAAGNAKKPAERRAFSWCRITIHESRFTSYSPAA
jgi:hypothetical protein